MKTTTTDFLTKQKAGVLRPDYSIELLEQFSGAITSRDSATQIKVSGDATDLLAKGDTFLIPLDDFETEYKLTSAPSYSGGETTLICSGASFIASGLVGLYVAKKRNITKTIIDGGISTIRITSEGKALNSSFADDVKITLDNTDEVYYAADGSSGIFNSGNYFWIRIYLFFLNDPTRFLWFGGIVYLKSVLPLDNELVEFICVGHLKELERYPGYYVAEAAETPILLNGLEIIGVSAASGAMEGPRTLKFKFPDGLDIKGLRILSVGEDTQEGWHIIKFQPPDLFQFDYGNWTSLTAGASDQALTSDRGDTLKIDVPANLDLVARQDLIWVVNPVAPAVDMVGRPSLIFDNGPKIILKYDFERIIRYKNSTSDYFDITRGICSNDVKEVDAWEGASDIIWIMSPKQFYGIDFFLDTDLVATFTFQYSRGYDDWGTLTKTDGTSNFSQNGTIVWDAPSDWRPTNTEIYGVSYENYFIIKITLSAYTSGSCAIKRALRYLRLYGSDGTALDIKVRLEKLPEEERIDEIILNEDSNGDLQPYAWKQMLSFQAYLETLLDIAEYNSAYRTLDDLKITSSARTISLYGPPPKPFYDKKPTALCVDTSTSPETVYIGVCNEIWKVNEQSGFTLIGTLDLYHKAAPAGYEKDVRCDIMRIVIDGNGYLQGFAVANYDEPYHGSGDLEFRRPAIVFRSTNLTSITEQNQVEESSYPCCMPVTRFFRNGYYHTTDKNEIGQNSIGSVQCGENICIPFRQICFYTNPKNLGSFNAVIYDVNGLTGNTISGSGRFYPGAYERFYLPPGFFFSSDNTGGDGDVGNLGFCFTLGQRGLVAVWNETDEVWMFQKWNGTDYYLANVNYSGTITTIKSLLNYNDQFAAGCYSAADQKFYLVQVTWDNNGGTFPADLSDCFIQSLPKGGGSYSQLFAFNSDSVEANQSLASGDEYYCTILEIIKNEDENTLHGCLINRDNLTYHYFVYDITNDKLYATQTGSGFTFQDNRQIKEFVYNTNDNKIYAVVADLRYEEETAFLISATFTAPTGGPDGTEITLTFEANIKSNETDAVQLTMGGSGRIYGLTGPKETFLWQYHDEFYPRFFLANTGNDNMRTILDKLSEAINMIHSIGPDRKIHFLERESNKGSMVITEAEHYLENTMSPLLPWGHYYDGVEVHWENPLTGERGIEKAGYFGFQRRVLTIKNYFIQFPQLAALIADMYYAFFNQQRNIIAFNTLPLWQLDNRDKFTFNFVIHSFHFKTTDEWIVSELELDVWKHELKIRGLLKA